MSPSHPMHPSARVRTVPLLLAIALLSLLAACSDGTRAAPTEEPASAGAPDPAYVLTVPLSRGDTVASVEEATGGRVLVWQEDDFALVGLDHAPEPEPETGTDSETGAESGAETETGTGTGTGDDEGTARPEPSRAEANDAAFMASGKLSWMSGSSYIWGGGSSYIWGGGSSYIWGGGDARLWTDEGYAWMPENTDEWRQIRLQEGHALARNLGYGVKVAIIDTGLDLEHPALVEALAPEDEWWDFYDDDPVPQEEGILGEGGYGHGSNVAGIVRQVAPRATLLPLRVLGPDGSGKVTDLAAAIAWAVDKGADVVNLSLGSSDTSAAVEAAIASATRRGVLVVSSTGNTGDTAVTYPATSAAEQKRGWQRLSVTSVDGEDDKSEFATYGEVVELAAPGEEIYGPAPGARTSAWSGTSMAAPMASGALALALGERLKVPRVDLADELRHRAYHDIYNNRNREYQHLLGRGRLDLVEFLRNVVDR